MARSAVLAACLCLFPAIAAAQYDAGYSSLGGVNLDRYCKAVHGARFKVVLVGRTAGDWKCTVDRKYGGYRYPISVEHACKLQYRRDGLKARALDWNDPLSWRCMQPRHIRPRAERGPIVRDHRGGPVVRDHRN